jgi:alpha-glucoside transport system substrate-binding protein
VFTAAAADRSGAPRGGGPLDARGAAMRKGHASLAWAILCTLVLVACARPGPSGNGRGGAVSVLGVWGGTELDSFRAMVKPFEARTGIAVQYEGTRDLDAVLTARVQGGNPPDLAVLPAPGHLAELARVGNLKPLDGAFDSSEMAREYPRAWIDLGRVNGRLYGIVIKTALKGLVWYNPRAWTRAGYRVPSSWAQLMSLTKTIASGGKTPWCLGLESGAASGWPATDWIAILLLRAAGPHVYTQWYRHELPWTDPRIRAAWQRFGQVAANPRYVYGGTAAVLATNFAQAPFPLYASPPGCYLHLQATFIEDFIEQQYPQVRPGRDLAFFMFPPIAPAYASDVEVAGDVVGMFRDTAQARALVRYLATAPAQEIWVRRGGALSANRDVPLSAYPDPLSRRAAQTLAAAGIAVFGASDMMPQAVTDVFYKATLEYVRDPGRLGELLTQVEQAARETYK